MQFHGCTDVRLEDLITPVKAALQDTWSKRNVPTEERLISLSFHGLISVTLTVAEWDCAFEQFRQQRSLAIKAAEEAEKAKHIAEAEASKLEA